jgi:hypothetical protein
MKRIKTASDLKLFLEAVAKESTSIARKNIKEDLEKEMEYVSRGLKNAKKNQSGYSNYMQIFEVDDEEEDQKNDMPEPEADAAKEEEDEKPSPAPAKEKQPNKAVISIPLVEEEPEFEDIVKAIGWVRAGPSIKGEMKDELQKYIEKLDEPEKKALYTMLSSMANILHKEIPGDKGQDPEDPPLNLIIDDPIDPKEEEKETQSSPESDSSAPIKVGKSQSLNEMRRIVRKLMAK